MSNNKLKRITLEGNEFQQALNEGQAVKAEEGGYVDPTGASIVVVKQACFGFVDKNADGITEEDGFGLDFKISDKSIDRHNDTVDPEGWQLENFLANPVVLWNHNSGEVPVGKARNTRLSGESLLSEAVFPSKDLFAFGNMVGRMVRNGFLNAASVGFKPIEAAVNAERMEDHEGWFAPVDFTKQELLEWSVVPIPANPNALQGAKSLGIDLAPMMEWCEKQLDSAGYLLVPRKTVEGIYAHGKNSATIYVKHQQHGLFQLSAAQDTSPVQEKATAAPPVEQPKEVPAASADDIPKSGQEDGTDVAKAVDNELENMYKSDSLSAEDFLREIVKAKQALKEELAPLLTDIRRSLENK